MSEHYRSHSLEDIIFRKSFYRGKVFLSSGKESTVYFDMKPSMFDPQGACLIADRVLQEAQVVKAEFVGGLEMGAVPIIGAVCHLSYGSAYPVRGMFVRKEPKTHGTKKLIEGLERGEVLSGKRVVIVEDVTTSGASALRAVHVCQDAGAKVVLVISIVDREEGAAAAFAEQKIPFLPLYRASSFVESADYH
jgi:orotate phosphoribosyltransferase